jgi:hypothetical protein
LGSFLCQDKKEQKNSTFELFDLTGRALYSVQIKQPTGQFDLDMSRYPSGVYLAVVRDSKGIRFQQKVVKE